MPTTYPRSGRSDTGAGTCCPAAVTPWTTNRSVSLVRSVVRSGVITRLVIALVWAALGTMTMVVSDDERLWLELTSR